MPDADEAMKALSTLGVGPAAAEAYKDALQPTFRELGGNLHAVAKLVTAALFPLHGVVWGLDRVREWLSVALVQRLAKAQPENIQPPPAYVAGQALLQLTFCADEQHLRELYANLLATAMDKATAGKVHPGFVEIIRQLSPDEALLIEHLRGRERWELSESHADFNFQGEEIRDQFRAACVAAGVRAADQSETYLDNFLRLRLLREVLWTGGTEVTLDSEAVAYGAHTMDRQVKRAGYVEMASSRVVEVSSFGLRFIDACVTGPWSSLDVDAGAPQA